LAIFNTIFDKLAVAYFFGPPCIYCGIFHTVSSVRRRQHYCWRLSADVYGGSTNISHFRIITISSYIVLRPTN